MVLACQWGGRSRSGGHDRRQRVDCFVHVQIFPPLAMGRGEAGRFGSHPVAECLSIWTHGSVRTVGVQSGFQLPWRQTDHHVFMFDDRCRSLSWDVRDVIVRSFDCRLFLWPQTLFFNSSDNYCKSYSKIISQLNVCSLKHFCFTVWWKWISWV